MLNKIRLLVLILLGGLQSVVAETVIEGTISIDTSRWAPVAYLSLIPDFTQKNTISYQDIIASSPIAADGTFQFPTEFLPEQDHLYRIHVSKKDAPPASLIIGGKDHNHIFVIAKKNQPVKIFSKGGRSLFGKATITGYHPNRSLQEVLDIKARLDSLDYYGSHHNENFVRQSINNSLRSYADTCQNPLVSLFAVYESDFAKDFALHPDFYNRFVDKWDSENSTYFVAFRNFIGYRPGIHWMVPVAIFLCSILLVFFIQKLIRHRRKSKMVRLTLQERKILAHLKSGMSNKEIADACAISVSTVKSHVNNIYAKLGVRSRKEVVDL
jgi:DNA-binding CsgD family transcriptional regulator